MNPISRRARLALLLPVCLFWNRSLVAAEGAGTVELEPAGVMQLGNVFSSEVRELKFAVVNKTDKPIRIAGIRATCSCTVPKAPSKEPVPPGGRAELSLQFIGAKVKEGPFERTAVVALEDAPVPSVLFEFKGTLVEPVSVVPGREVRLPAAKTPDDTWESKVQIRGHLPNEQRLVLVNPPAGERLITDLKETAPSAYELTVTPKLPQAKGVFTEDVKLPVREPAGMPPVVIRFQGQVGTVLSIQGRNVRVWRSSSGTPVTRTIPLSQLSPLAPRTPGKPQPQTAIPPGEVTIKTPPGVTAVVHELRGRSTLKLTFSPEVLQPGARGAVQVQTKCCGDATVTYEVMNEMLPEEE